jgi:hypothetical protein
MAGFEFKIPQISGLNQGKDLSSVIDALMSLGEQLKHVLNNLDEDNMSPSFLSEYLKSINIKTKNNTVAINQTIGIEILKGALGLLFLDDVGELNFNGNMVGGKIDITQESLEEVLSCVYGNYIVRFSPVLMELENTVTKRKLSLKMTDSEPTITFSVNGTSVLSISNYSIYGQSTAVTVGSLTVLSGASGTFMSDEGKTISVSNGIITSIS